MTETQPKRRSSFWREIPILVVVAVVVAIVVRAFVLQTFYIPSESMEHTLNINDRVLVNKVVYHFREPHRGEVIVFTSPVSWRTDPNETDFIKRIIATAGDRVVCCDSQHRLTINGRSLSEPYIYKDGNGVSDPASEAPFDITVPAGRLWVMGDHRSHSGDSREQFLRTRDVNTSTIAEDAVVGRAFVLFWPVGRMSLLSVPDSYSGIPDRG